MGLSRARARVSIVRIPDYKFLGKFRRGISKINVNTECQIAFAKAEREYFEQGLGGETKGYNPQRPPGS